MTEITVTPKPEYAFDVKGTSEEAKSFVVKMVSAATPYGGTMVEQRTTEEGEYVRFAFKSHELCKCWLTAVGSLLK